MVQDIHDKAEEPLAEAMRAGWGEKAKEFLLFNLAEKVGAGRLTEGVGGGR